MAAKIVAIVTKMPVDRTMEKSFFRSDLLIPSTPFPSPAYSAASFPVIHASCPRVRTQLIHHMTMAAIRTAERKFRVSLSYRVTYNLASFMWTLAFPKEVEHWSLTTLREKLVKMER